MPHSQHQCLGWTLSHVKECQSHELMLTGLWIIPRRLEFLISNDPNRLPVQNVLDPTNQSGYQGKSWGCISQIPSIKVLPCHPDSFLGIKEQNSPMDIKKIINECCKQLCPHKFDSLDEMDQFFKRHNCQNSQEEIKMFIHFYYEDRMS